MCQARVAHLTRTGYSRTPSKTLQLAELDALLLGDPGEHVVEDLEELPRLGDALALDRLGHQRGRGGADGAAVALEADLLDDPVLDPQVDLDDVAAQRVVAVGGAGRAVHGVAVPGLLVVVEDDLLVELAQIGHQPKTSRTFSRPATRASISSTRVVEAERGAHRGRNAVARHHRLGAVVAGADRDALRVEDGADVVGVDAVHDEGQHRGLALRRADQAHPGDGEDRLGGCLQELCLVGGDALEAELVEVVERGGKTDRALDVGRAGLEAVWRLVEGRPSKVTDRIMSPPPW